MSYNRRVKHPKIVAALLIILVIIIAAAAVSCTSTRGFSRTVGASTKR